MIGVAGLLLSVGPWNVLILFQNPISSSILGETARKIAANLERSDHDHDVENGDGS